MFKKLRINSTKVIVSAKCLAVSKKEIYKDIHFLCLEASDILEDISEDLDDLHESVQDSLRLTLTIQKQCNQIIALMEKKDDRTLAEIVDNIEKLVGKGNADE